MRPQPPGFHTPAAGALRPVGRPIHPSRTLETKGAVVPQVNQTPSETPAQDALNQALVGACHTPAAASELIEAFRAEVMTKAGTSLSELGYGSAGGLLVDTAEVIRPRAAKTDGGAA